MNRFFRQFDLRHTLKHTLLTAGLTAVFGPGGFAIGFLYCIGDTVDEMKKCKDSDFVEFLQSLPPASLKILIRR